MTNCFCRRKDEKRASGTTSRDETNEDKGGKGEAQKFSEQKFLHNDQCPAMAFSHLKLKDTFRKLFSSKKWSLTILPWNGFCQHRSSLQQISYFGLGLETRYDRSRLTIGNGREKSWKLSHTHIPIRPCFWVPGKLGPGKSGPSSQTRQIGPPQLGPRANWAPVSYIFVLDIHCQQLGNICQLEGVCVHFLEYTYSRISIFPHFLVEYIQYQ